MKRLLLFAVLLACIVSGQSLANPITRQKALENAQAFLKSKGRSVMAQSVRKAPMKATAQSDNQPYYLFNVGNNQGFVVAAGDDNVPAILGYSDKGTILPDSLPSNMKEWLKGYQEQIEYIQKHNIAASDILTASHPAISPLLTTTWDQDEPYNNSCPDFFTGDRCVTGCVATAMAQVMYYHRNSSVTKVMKRIEGYTCRHKWISGSDTLRVNVNAVAAGSTIDWSNMLNSYSGSETSTQKKAVADLMFYCGASVGMDYADSWNGGSGASYSNVPNALKTYFDYSSSTQYVRRSNYTDTEWDNLIYNELSNKRPVMYSGQTSSSLRSSGHAFVVDGYDGNGYYNINWGWGGYCDGSFTLSGLIPEGEGIGGSSGGYNYSQAAITGAVPNGNVTPDNPIYSGVVLNSTNFPDATFRAYISELTGVAENGTISEDKLNQIKSINVDDKGITSLKGVEYFTALTILDCSWNQLTSLDVSKNTALTSLWCTNNQLASLDVSRNTALKTLSCSNNHLTSLDVSKNSALTTLSCYSNQLTSLSLNNNTQISSISFSGQTISLSATIDQTRKYQIVMSTGFVLSKVSEFVVNGVTVSPTMSNGKLTFASSSKPTYISYKYDTENSVAGKMGVTINVNAPDAPVITGIVLNSTNFPDATFRAYISELTGVAENGTISEEKLLAVKTISVGEKGIASLKGVEFFTALTYLACRENQLTSLDVSKNTALTDLWCSDNQLTSLDVSKNTALIYLSCYKNQLASLDVSKNTSLTNLYCYNNQLTSLDLSTNIALEYLSCSDNLLTSLDVTKNTTLKTLRCNSNQLSCLDVSKNTALTKLNFSNNQLASFDVSKNIALTELSCYTNLLTSLNVSKNTSLTILYCYDNRLTSLDVTENTALTRLSCYTNQLSCLDVSKNTALEYLSCGTNKLTSLDVSKNTALKSLSCYSNQLSSLDVSKNTALTSLSCGTNKLTSLDVSKNTELTDLSCSNNQLTSLSLKNNTKISYIFMYWQTSTLTATIDQTGKYLIDMPTGFVLSKVSEFKVNGVTVTPTMSNEKLTFASSSKPTYISYKYDTDNSVAGKMDVTINVNASDAPAITGVELNSTNFPDATFRAYISELTGVAENGTISEDKLLAVKTIFVNQMGITSLKGVEFFTALKYLYCYNNQLSSLDVSKNTSLTNLYCYNNQLTSLDLSKNIALEYLYCYNNQLTSLDVTKNTTLTELNCSNNQLTNLDLFKNTALTKLDCNTNHLSSLDVSKNTALKSLSCGSNHLTNLDVSMNTALTKLDCNNNKLNSLDVSKNTALTSFYCYYNQLTSLDVTKNIGLTELWCDNNQLTNLDVTKNTALLFLFCFENQLTSLDVTKNSALIGLLCNENQLISLNVSKNTAVTCLSCSNNHLNSLDVSKNTALNELYCYGNHLTSLDLSKNTQIRAKDISHQSLILSASSNVNRYSINVGTGVNGTKISDFKVDGVAVTPSVQNGVLSFSSSAKPQVITYMYDTDNSVAGKMDVTINLEIIDAPVLDDRASLSVSEFSVQQGEDERMSINMDNEGEIIMAEFYMQLPEGLHIATDADGYYDATLGDRADRTHTLEVGLGTNGLYHFLAYSTKNKPFTGTEGELLSVNITCDESVDAGIYQGKLRGILMSNTDKQSIEQSDITFNIEVTDYLLGDVNHDRRINGMDIVEMVELIMSSSFDRAGDLYPSGNPDGVINGMDLVEEVELVMSQTLGNNAPALAARTERLAMKSERSGVKSLGIQSDRPFILAQMTVELSEGMTLSSITSDRRHEVAYRQTADNKYVVVCYSNRNETFETNGKALEFHCLGDGGIRVSDVLLIDADKQECLGTDAQSGEVTGIQEMKDERLKMNDSDIYDLSGRKIESSKLRSGVYVVNGRKVLEK